VTAAAPAERARAAPILETPRLILRGHRESDIDALEAMMADPETVRFVGGEPLSREQTWRKMIGGAGLWPILGFGYWTVERNADRRPIGQLGFADMKRDLTPSIEGIPEMGWMFARDVAGQGYASEAAAAALAWADGALGVPEIVAIIDAANRASIRVAEKAGFAEREPALYDDAPILLFRRRTA